METRRAVVGWAAGRFNVIVAFASAPMTALLLGVTAAMAAKMVSAAAPARVRQTESWGTRPMMRAARAATTISGAEVIASRLAPKFGRRSRARVDVLRHEYDQNDEVDRARGVGGETAHDLANESCA